MTREEALNKLQRYCSYQDRCHKEVRSKLLSIKVYGDLLEEIMVELINDGYLNEERYARNYARGKYRIKGWGKMKIYKELKFRKISEYCIKKAMQEVDEAEGYEETLKSHLVKYKEQRQAKMSRALLMKKTYAHGISKGFESALVSQMTANLFTAGYSNNT